MRETVWVRPADPVRYRSAVSIALLFLALFAAAAGFTPDKTQKIKVHKTNGDVKVLNIGCESEKLNPLREEEHPEVSSAVRAYYTELGKKEDFVERYDGFRVYTKVGKYRGTYIAFVQYRMKIRDVYTEVPGLSVLYVSQSGEDGEYLAAGEMPDGQDESYIRSLAGHPDVQSLMEKTEEAYEAAVGSDALLREALADLADACEDPAG